MWIVNLLPLAVIALFTALVFRPPWKKTLIVLLLYTIIEGALRKWAMPNANRELFFLKNLIAIVAYMSYFLIDQKIKIKIPTHILTILMIVFILWMGVGLVNPELPDVRIGLIASTYYLIYLPIIFLFYNSFKTLEDIIKPTYMYCLTSIPLSILGMVQFASPKDSFINKYVWSAAEQSVATFAETGKVRITATFSYISPYTSYLLLTAMLAITILIITKDNKQKLALSIALSLISINLLMTGSRFPVFFLMINIIAVLFVSGFNWAILKKYIPVTIGISLITLFLILYVFQGAYQSFIGRTQKQKDASRRFQGFLSMPYYTLRDGGYAGHGLGATYQAAGQIFQSKEMGAEYFPWSEIIHDRIGIELGPIGFLIQLLIRYVILAGLYNIFRRSKNVNLRVVALTIFLYQLTFLWSIPVYNALSMIYFCMTAGVFLFLEKLYKMEQYNKLMLRNNNITSVTRTRLP